MKQIAVQNTFALVDDDMFVGLSAYRWRLVRGYAYTTRRRTLVGMHQMICQVAVGFTVDHIDRNRLNNQRSNLRAVTFAQNTQNRSKQNNTTSKYRGVSWRKRSNKWQVQFTVDGKRTYVGLFDDEVEAAKAYDKAVLLRLKSFAVPNFGPSCDEAK